MTYTSPLKTNTCCRRMGLYTGSGSGDRSDPDVAIKPYRELETLEGSDPDVAIKPYRELETLEGERNIFSHVSASTLGKI